MLENIAAGSVKVSGTRRYALVNIDCTDVVRAASGQHTTSHSRLGLEVHRVAYAGQSGKSHFNLFRVDQEVKVGNKPRPAPRS